MYGIIFKYTKISMYKQGDFSFLSNASNEMMVEIYEKFTTDIDLWIYLHVQNDDYDPMVDKYVLGHTFDFKFPHSAFTMLRCMLDIMCIVRNGWDEYVESCV